MYNQIDARSSFSLIFLLAIISPTFCSERNQTSFPDFSTIKEHLRLDSHVTEIYFTNETLQNSSIPSNENQTLQTTQENQNISIILQIPLKNSPHFENSTVIDPKWNGSNVNKDQTTQGTKTGIPDGSNEISTTEDDFNSHSTSYPTSYFNYSNVLTVNVSILSPKNSEKFPDRREDAEISPNSILNTSQKHDAELQDFGKGNITGVGIKATVSVSFHLMENGNENITEALNRTETSQNKTESSQVSYNVSTDFKNTEDNSSVAASNVNRSGDVVTENVTEIEIIKNENQTEAFVVTTVTDAAVISNASVTDSDLYNNTASDAASPTAQNSTISNDATAYTAAENVTELSTERAETSEKTEMTTATETSTTSFPETTLTEETTTERQPLTKLWGVIKIVDGMDWSPEFLDRQSTYYKDTASRILILLEEFYTRTNLNQFLQEVQIDGFSEGSLVIDYFLILKMEPLDVDSLVHQVNSLLKESDYLLGEFTIDPKATEFEVIREETKKPTSAPNIEPPVPQWVIAVVVISAASFIFILLFSAVTIYERHYTRRVYNTKLQDEEEIFEKSVTLNGRSNQAAYENLAADLVYDIDKDELEDSSQYWKTVR